MFQRQQFLDHVLLFLVIDQLLSKNYLKLTTKDHVFQKMKIYLYMKKKFFRL